jgi:hypothetical protein
MRVNNGHETIASTLIIQHSRIIFVDTKIIIGISQYPVQLHPLYTYSASKNLL